MRKAWKCPKCGHYFTTRHGTIAHMRDKHGIENGEPVKREKQPKKERDYADMSLAEISIEASMKQAMGEPLDPLEESLIFD